MLFIKRYQDRNSKKVTCSIVKMHNNKYTNLGVFSLSGVLSYLMQSNCKDFDIVNVKTVKDLENNHLTEKTVVINQLKG